MGKISGTISSHKNSLSQKNIKRILDIVKKSVTPDKDIIKQVDKIVDAINEQIIKSRTGAVCVKGGSIGKDTYLKNDNDVDLFVKFNMEYKDKDISDILERILQKIFKNISRIHGSRDYFQFVKQDAHYEIIPVLNIHPSNYNDIQNVTDMSPEHVVWVGKYTENDPGLKDEIRLAKQFCKSCNAYCAESYIKGFSGHIIDILIIYYGSFINMIRSFSLLNNISKENPVIIDVERHLKDPLKELNESKLSPLIIIDPVQPERNSAAALGEEKLGIFISACRYFLEKPDMSYFSIKRFNLDDKVNGSIKSIRRSSKQKIKVVVLDIITLGGSKDVVGTKVLKVYEEAIKHCRLNGFIVLGSGWDFEYEKKSAVIYLIFDKRSLSAQDEHIGPPLSSKQDAEKFKKKHGDKVFIKDNRLYAMIPRAYIDPEDFMKDFINKDFIKIRIRSIKIKKIIVR